MPGWEYKVVVLPASKYDVDAEILSLHGEKGWELVSVILDASNHRACYLKRPTETQIEETEPGLG